ncbi:creatininase family protein, partial [Marine Group I thaumarchaeote]|nr:creatininase family protein [Marine Group I thaumarchaeote]
MKVMDANELYDPEFRKLIKSKKSTIIIPVGSIEQHGAHLPITTDSDIVTEIASRLAKKCGFIVFPTISYGLSFEHEPLSSISIRDVDYRSF